MVLTAYPVPRVSVVLDCLDRATLVQFWCAVLGYRQVLRTGAFTALAAPEGQQGPAFILQEVQEFKIGKNRMHLDLHPPPDPGLAQVVARLETMGGRRLSEPVTELYEDLGIWWITMSDPEGNEFDLVADHGHPPPPEALYRVTR